MGKTITVCDQCLTASCWHGEFMCSGSPNAGTVEKTRAELRRLNREHPDNYSARKIREVCGV